MNTEAGILDGSILMKESEVQRRRPPPPFPAATALIGAVLPLPGTTSFVPSPPPLPSPGLPTPYPAAPALPHAQRAASILSRLKIGTKLVCSGAV